MHNSFGLNDFTNHKVYMTLFSSKIQLYEQNQIVFFQQVKIVKDMFYDYYHLK